MSEVVAQFIHDAISVLAVAAVALVILLLVLGVGVGYLVASSDSSAGLAECQRWCEPEKLQHYSDIVCECADGRSVVGVF